MYGLVNRAIEDMAIQSGGHEIWEAIKLKAGVDESTFLSMQTYPDEITYSLVNSASELLSTPADELLRAFGRHWILFTAKEGYGDILKITGQNLTEFIENLDTMHSRVASTMPELNPPSFECHYHSPDKIEVRYFSERQGLAPMVVGLLEGVGEMFETPVKVTHKKTQSSDDFEVFDVEYLDSKTTELVQG